MSFANVCFPTPLTPHPPLYERMSLGFERDWLVVMACVFCHFTAGLYIYIYIYTYIFNLVLSTVPLSSYFCTFFLRRPCLWLQQYAHALVSFSSSFEGNYPYRGQKHEIFDGGVHVAGFVYSALLGTAASGTSSNAVIHATDWGPTILALANAAPLPHTDGYDVWGCLTDVTKCLRTEMVLNINLICDSQGGGPPPPPPGPPSPKPNNATCLKDCVAVNSTTGCNCHCYCTKCDGCGNGCYDKCTGSNGCTEKCNPHEWFRLADPSAGFLPSRATQQQPLQTPQVQSSSPEGFNTEAPAPKAGIRVGNHKLLVECFNSSTQTIHGKVLLFDLNNDPSESTDIAEHNPDVVAKLSARIVFYGSQASVPMGDRPPWQGSNYYCAGCVPGRPKGLQPHPMKNGTSNNTNGTWEPWCFSATDQPCLG